MGKHKVHMGTRQGDEGGCLVDSRARTAMLWMQSKRCAQGMGHMGHACFASIAGIGAAGARHEGTGACAVHKHGQGMASGTRGAGALRALLGASARAKGVGTGQGARRTNAVDKQSKDDSDAVDAKPAMYTGHGAHRECFLVDKQS